MFDGPNSLLKFETDAISNISVGGMGLMPEIGGFCDSEETYKRLKAEAMDKILKSTPKMLRARLESGDF